MHMMGNRKLLTTPIVGHCRFMIGHTFTTPQLHSGSFRVSVLPYMHTTIVYCGETLEII